MDSAIATNYSAAVTTIGRALQSGRNSENAENDATEMALGSLVFAAVLFLALVLCFCSKPSWSCRAPAPPGATTSTAGTTPTAQRRRNNTPTNTATVVAEEEPKIDFQKKLQSTTMQVRSGDILARDVSQKITGDTASAALNNGSTMFDIELGHNSEDVAGESSRQSVTESSRVLRLPKNKPNADRLVPCFCSICLSSYKKGELVSWSDSSKCSHAFHTSCMVRYADACTARDRSRTHPTKPHPVIPCPLCRESCIQKSER